MKGVFRGEGKESFQNRTPKTLGKEGLMEFALRYE